MKQATRLFILAAALGGILGAGAATAAAAPAEEAGATAGLAVACGAQAPELREFIRQSMSAIEARSRSPEELERNMNSFADAFARSAFPRVPGAGCATLPQESQRVYRSLGGQQALALSRK